MSAVTETFRQPGKLGATVSDWWVITWRNLLAYIRKPDLLVFSTIQPIMFVLLFVYVFGGTFELILPASVPYVDFLMPASSCRPRSSRRRRPASASRTTCRRA